MSSNSYRFKGTAGEWFMSDDGVRTAINTQIKHVAMVNYGPEIGDKEHIANARLIAAAPELFEALYRLLSDISGEGEYTGLRPEYAYAALAKATGEDNE